MKEDAIGRGIKDIGNWESVLLKAKLLYDNVTAIEGTTSAIVNQRDESRQLYLLHMDPVTHVVTTTPLNYDMVSVNQDYDPCIQTVKLHKLGIGAIGPSLGIGIVSILGEVLIEANYDKVNIIGNNTYVCINAALKGKQDISLFIGNRLIDSRKVICNPFVRKIGDITIFIATERLGLNNDTGDSLTTYITRGDRLLVSSTRYSYNINAYYTPNYPLYIHLWGSPDSEIIEVTYDIAKELLWNPEKYSKVIKIESTKL